MSASLGKIYLHPVVVDVVIYGTSRIRAASDTCHEIVRIVAAGLFRQLPLYLFRYNALHSGDNVGVGMWSHGGAYNIECVFRVAAPVAYRFRAGIAESHVACCYRMHLRAKHLHTFYVCMLALDICLSHEYLTFHVHQGAYRSSRHTMLPSTCLGYNTCLAHFLCHEYLSNGIVYLVCTCVVEVFTFEIQAASILLAHALGEVQW